MTGGDIAPIWPMAHEATRELGRSQSCRCAMRPSMAYRITPRGSSPMSIADLAVPPEPRVTFDRISLRRLVLIRWVAIAGQAVALLVVHYAFDFRVPLAATFSVVGCSVALNLCVTLYRRSATRLGEREAAV